MDFSISSNAMIQNNAEGLMRKKATHTQRKNCGSRNTEEKQLLKLMGDTTGMYMLNNNPSSTLKNKEIDLDQ